MNYGERGLQNGRRGQQGGGAVNTFRGGYRISERGGGSG